MELSDYLPFWSQLTAGERETLKGAAVRRTLKRGTVLHYGKEDCVGLFIVRSGQLRAFILSEEGREITLYRLFEQEICLFSASCMLPDIHFEITIEAEQDTNLWVIPTEAYRRVMEESAAVANYTNQLMATRFSEVMWLVDQILFKSVDTRLAAFLLEERSIQGGDALVLTHEKIARHLGTAREVVSRMLKYFQTEGLVVLSRGEIRIQDAEHLRKRAEQ